MPEGAIDPGAHIVGRESELAALDEFLSPGASSRALVLWGEPGIGKTTLWEAAIAGARGRGLLVLAARPSPAETQASFGALGDLFDGLHEEALAGLAPPSAVRSKSRCCGPGCNSSASRRRSSNRERRERGLTVTPTNIDGAPGATRRARTRAACAVFGLLLAACGGDVDAKNAYVGQVNQAQQKFAGTVTGLSQEVATASSSKADSHKLRGFEQAIDGVVSDLKGITPPAEVKASHGELVSAMRHYGKDMQRASGALDERDAERRERAARALARSSTKAGTRIDTAIDSINKQLGGGS